MAVLVTGASGFVGQALVPKLIAQGHTVYALSRHPPAAAFNLIPLAGDITRPNLALDRVPDDIDTVYHVAGKLKLGEDKDGSIFETNVTGTKNVISFCARHGIDNLQFVSTAYTLGRNTYERSKALCEMMLSESDIPRITIFKPSIIMGTQKNPFPGHFSQFASLVIRVHKRAELIRRKIEGTLRLPVIEPVLKVRGNPEGKLNLVPVDSVVKAMVLLKESKTYYLTNPDPPTLGQLIQWIGEFTLVNIKMLPEPFKPTPIEAQFRKMARAFEPYLWGDSFKSDILDCSPRISRKFIHATIARSLSS